MEKDKDSNKVDFTSTLGEKALDFVQQILTDPISELTGTLKDKFEYVRFKNKVNILLKVKKFLESKGIKTESKIPMKDLSTLLEYSSFEDEEQMQDKWASLLANTLDPKNKFNSCHLFSQVLNQLSINEINILTYLLNKSFLTHAGEVVFIEQKRLINQSGADYNTALIVIDNLLRLGLIERDIPVFKEKSPNVMDISFRMSSDYNEKSKIEVSNSFGLTKFGEAFIRKVYY
jgi:hypothetical protein